MSLNVAYLPEAEDDIEAAYIWYDQQRTGLGDEFLEALCDSVNWIRENPKLYAVFRRAIRAAPLRRFPYVVYYTERTTDILVIAVQHGRRSTRVWRGRF